MSYSTPKSIKTQADVSRQSPEMREWNESTGQAEMTTQGWGAVSLWKLQKHVGLSDDPVL